MVKLVFLGTSSFSIGVLEALIKAKYDIRAIVTQPDRACGRGRVFTAPPVKAWARQYQFPIFQPEKINQQEFLDILRGISPDVLVVAAYGQILRSPLLQLAPGGCLNVHASLLPRYRGADPIRWALLKGERVTGVTIMLMDKGIDTGPVLASQEVPIEESDNGCTLETKLGQVGGDILVRTLPLWMQGIIQPIPQDSEQATYVGKIVKDLYRIDWSRSAEEIVHQIRAFAPCPGAYGLFRKQRMKILKARVLDPKKKVPPGNILGYDPVLGIQVGTGEGVIAIEELQPANRKAQSCQEFCCGYRIQAGEKFY